MRRLNAGCEMWTASAARFARLVREALKQGMPGTRSILLPPPLIRSALQAPLLRDLLVTRVGYSGEDARIIVDQRA